MMCAVIAVALAVGAWWGIRWADSRQRVNDLTTYLASIPGTEWERS